VIFDATEIVDVKTTTNELIPFPYSPPVTQKNFPQAVLKVN
jgi:hypothetical protein